MANRMTRDTNRINSGEDALRVQGLTILRFTNDDVLADLDAVCLAIQLEAEKLIALQPSPRGEGGEQSEPGEGTIDDADSASNDDAMIKKQE